MRLQTMVSVLVMAGISAGQSTKVDGTSSPPASSGSAAAESRPAMLSETFADELAPVSPRTMTVTETNAVIPIAEYSDINEYPFFHARFLYWEATDPNPDGRIIRSTSTSPQSIQFDSGFAVGDPNTRPEPGFELTYGRPLNDLWNWEISGHWVHPYDHPMNFQAGTLVSGTTIITDTIFLTANADESIDFASIRYYIKNFGFEANGRVLLYQTDRLRVDGIAGIRFVEADEEFDMFLRPNPASSAIFRENFQTENSFFGPQFGSEARYLLHDYVSLRGGVKLGFAANFQDLNIAGPAPGTGRFTGAANVGTYDQTEYATVIELGFGVIFHLTPYIDLNVGYDALWFSTMLRATDQLGLPGVLADGVSVTAPPLSNETFLIGGFTTGLEIRF